MKKKILANKLIQNNLVKPYDVIAISYSEKIEKAINGGGLCNVRKENNISPTLDTRCDCLGVVVIDR